MNTAAHGRHIKVVGYGNPTVLGDLAKVRAFLVRLVTALGMRALGEPVMHDVALDIGKLGCEPFEDEGGITGTVVLSTSHCAIHTWPVREFFVLDVFSCRDFEERTVGKLVREVFGPTQTQTTDLSMALIPPSRTAAEDTLDPPSSRDV